MTEQPWPIPQPALILSACMRAKPEPVTADMTRRLEAMLPELRSEARRLTPNWTAADRLVQRTLLRLWTELADSDPVVRESCPRRLARKALDAELGRARPGLGGEEPR